MNYKSFGLRNTRYSDRKYYILRYIIKAALSVWRKDLSEMELKLLFVIFIARVSTRATIETEFVEVEGGRHLLNEVLSDDDVEDEDFLDGIDEDLDYFYTYEAIKNLQMMTPKPDNGTNATIDMAEKFFLNFLTEEDYEGEEDYSYEYEDDAMDDLAGSEAKDTDSYDYTELDEIDHDDFIYFDTLDDFEGQNSGDSLESRDTILMLILAAVVSLVLVSLLLLYLRSRRHQSETDCRAQEEETQGVDNDNLLREIV